MKILLDFLFAVEAVDIVAANIDDNVELVDARFEAARYVRGKIVRYCCEDFDRSDEREYVLVGLHGNELVARGCELVERHENVLVEVEQADYYLAELQEPTQRSN
jgi:hypothetical protein